MPAPPPPHTRPGIPPATPPSNPKYTRSRWRRPSVLVAAGVGVAVLIAGAVAVWAWPTGGGKQPAAAADGDTQSQDPGLAAPGATEGPEGNGGLGKAPRTAAPTKKPPANSGGSVPSSFPNEGSTGVPAGTSLKRSASLDLKKNGQVLTGLDIVGCLDVYASNVTIRKSRITCDRDTFAVRTYDSTRNLVLEDVEIDGSGKNSTAICCGNYTLRRVEIRNVIDGPRLGSNTTVVDSWIHDLARVPDSHNDALQTTGARDIVVRHNRIETYNAKTGDPFNACLMVGSTTGPVVANLLFEDNYCNGGNYSIGIREDLNAENVVFRRNAFGRDFRYGVVARPNLKGITWESSNVYLDTKKPVVE